MYNPPTKDPKRNPETTDAVILCQRSKIIPKSPVENVAGSIAEHTYANPPATKAEICVEGWREISATPFVI
jgi:hypothetical protein